MHAPGIASGQPEPPASAFVAVPDGSNIMSPDNRDNPDLTDAQGFYRWDVVDGWYKVQAQKTDCTSDESPALSVAEGYPATDVNLILNCGETPPDDLIIWPDNSPTDEFWPNVLVDVVYNDEGRGAYPTLVAEHGSLDSAKMITLANDIATHGGNVMNVVYDATDLELWVAYAEGSDEAYQRTYVHLDLNDYFQGDGGG